MQDRVKCAVAGCLAGLALAAAVAPQAGATTIGQLAPPHSAANCSFIIDILSPTVTKGETYVVPSYATAITSWSTSAADGPGQQVKFKVFRPVSGETYQAIAHDGPRALTGGMVNTFAINIPVLPGDLIGLNTFSGATNPIACDFQDPDFVSPTDRNHNHLGDMADGDVQTFPPGSVTHTNVTAVVKPINTFTLGAIARNKKKGTATIAVDVPAPGELVVSGKDAKGAAVRSSTAVSAPGTTTLTIRAKGKARKKLAETGKAKVKPKITYTPTDGDAATKALRLVLKKKV